MNEKEGVSGAKINTTKTPQENNILVAVKSRLDLTPDKKHHEANISCEVSHTALETPIVRSVMMVVKYPPQASISVDSAKIKENDDVSLDLDFGFGDGGYDDVVIVVVVVFPLPFFFYFFFLPSFLFLFRFTLLFFFFLFLVSPFLTFLSL